MGLAMKTFSGLIVFALLFAASANAQTSTDAADVWVVVEAQWNADESGSKKWIDESLVDEFSGWPASSPAPRSKASVKLWDRVSDDMGKTVAHELYPLSIVVSGDTAVAHYLYSIAVKGKDGKIEMSNGRYTDVLVRTEDGWKFLAWHGGQDSDD